MFKYLLDDRNGKDPVCITINFTTNPNFKGCYLSDSETILLNVNLKTEDIYPTILHELTHYYYDKHYETLEPLLEKHYDNESGEIIRVGDFLSEALATFNGKYMDEIVYHAYRIKQLAKIQPELQGRPRQK